MSIIKTTAPAVEMMVMITENQVGLAAIGLVSTETILL